MLYLNLPVVPTFITEACIPIKYRYIIISHIWHLLLKNVDLRAVSPDVSSWYLRRGGGGSNDAIFAF